MHALRKVSKGAAPLTIVDKAIEEAYNVLPLTEWAHNRSRGDDVGDAAKCKMRVPGICNRVGEGKGGMGRVGIYGYKRGVHRHTSTERALLQVFPRRGQVNFTNWLAGWRIHRAHNNQYRETLVTASRIE